MKKQFLTLIVLIAVIFSVCGQVFGAADEALVNSFLEKTYYEQMIFKGSNANWICKYVVNTPVNPSVKYCPKIQVTLTPRTTWTSGALRIASVHIHTSNGCIKTTRYLKSGENITLEVTSPIPEADETFPIFIDWCGKTDLIEMSNTVPTNVVSPQQAFQAYLEYFYSKNQSYPDPQYTFEIIRVAFVRPMWAIYYDNGNGQTGYEVVDGLTGRVDDSGYWQEPKVEE